LADGDAMAPYRARFKAGMDHYVAGEFAAAIDAWEEIYRAVGPEKGYRVAFDLGRAYDKLGEAEQAAPKYAAFLHGLDERRASGQAIEPVVTQEAAEARARLDALTPDAGGAASAAPDPASDAGAELAGASDAGAGAAAMIPPAAPATPPPPEPKASQPVARTERGEAPVPGALLVAAGAATLVAAAVSAVEYGVAGNANNNFNAAKAARDVPEQITDQATYDSARTGAYAGLGASLGLAALTAALTAWHVFGTKAHAVRVTPTVSGTAGGAQAGAVVTF
jgi:hypothetical protein